MALFPFIRKQKNTEPVNYLDMVPRPLTGHEIRPDGGVALLIPRFTSRIWHRLLDPGNRRPFIRLHLDTLGSSTWLLIDGKRTVEEICQMLTAQHGDAIQPVEDRVTRFLTQLLLNKYITFKRW